MRRFRDNPDNAPEKVDAYQAHLTTLTDAELSKECSDKIWLSAYASNNPTSCYHWQCDATYNECVRREKVDIYSSAHTSIMREGR